MSRHDGREGDAEIGGWLVAPPPRAGLTLVVDNTRHDDDEGLDRLRRQSAVLMWPLAAVLGALAGVVYVLLRSGLR